MLVNLPTTAFADVTANVRGIISDLWPYIAILLGVVIGFFIIESVIFAVIRKKDDHPPVN